MSTIIKTEGICRDFKVGSSTISALKNISIEIEKRSITLLRGRSGSGKTTLMNILGIIDAPTNGEIYIDNKKVSEMNDSEKNYFRQNRIGYVFQAGALIPNMTIYENVELMLRIKKIPLAERKKRVEESVAKVGLTKKLHRYAQEMSGGEVQRIGIARVLAYKPDIIFADEPTSALDFNTGSAMVRLFKEMVAKDGCTLVLTTHDPKVVPIADYIYNLSDGEVVNE